jgi:hypothetical protein
MFDLDKEKERVTELLSEGYSQNRLTMEEYERLLDYINRIETPKEAALAEKIIRESAAPPEFPVEALPAPGKNHLSMFSWRSSSIKPSGGSGGAFTSVFGTNQILADSLPPGRTAIRVHSVFGLTEIIVPQDVRVVLDLGAPVFSGVFVSPQVNRDCDGQRELHITGGALFGNITIKSSGEKAAEYAAEQEFAQAYLEKMKRNLLDEPRRRRRRTRRRGE